MCVQCLHILQGEREYHEYLFDHVRHAPERPRVITAHAPKGERGAPFKRARSLIDLVAELQMPPNLAMGPEHESLDELQTMWSAISRNASMTGQQKQLMIIRLASYIVENGPGTESYAELESLLEVEEGFETADSTRRYADDDEY
jgi:hypothetical protein